MPLFFGFSMIFGMKLMEQWNRNNPGLMDLNMVLQQHTSMNSRWLKNQPHPTDRQFAIYIASHYRNVVTNDAIWTGAFTLSLIKGEARKFAEQSVANYPAPSPEEVKDADAALKESLAQMRAFDFSKQPWFPLFMASSALFIYVCVPALLAALLFRGGLVLLIARVTFVQKDGERASRLRVFWRALVAWSPIMLEFALAAGLKVLYGPLATSVAVVLVISGLTIWSLALPERGLPDRLAGTWPVPR
jgi:hypothetical protein